VAIPDTPVNDPSGPDTTAGPSASARALARLYDLDLETDEPGDVDLYLALAARTGDPILELGAGTGRLAVALAAAGHRVTAVDLDPAMMERGRERAAAARVADRIEWVERDILELERRALPDSGLFSLAILALNSLFLLRTRSAQAAALRVMASHLRAGGLAVVDVLLPAAAELARYDGRLLLDRVHVDPETGRTVTKTWAATHDGPTASVVLTTVYDEGLPGEPPVRWVRRDPMRLVSPDELRGSAEAAGLEVETLAAGYDLEPLGPGAERAVLVARRP
jgi:SAM-dependent methyltransferase